MLVLEPFSVLQDNVNLSLLFTSLFFFLQVCEIFKYPHSGKKKKDIFYISIKGESDISLIKKFE